jgi:Tfp pilus assembly protein PilF
VAKVKLCFFGLRKSLDKPKYFNTSIFLVLVLLLVPLPVRAQEVKQFGDALATNSQSHKIEDTRSLSHYILGNYYEVLGDLKEAAGQYRKAQETDPGSSLIYLNLASVSLREGNPDLAIEELKQSVKLNPEAVEPHALLALIYTAQNNPDLASGEYVLALENASKLEPGNIDIYKGLGGAYLQQKKLKQAEGIFKLVSNIAPEDAETHLYLGDIYYNLKDYSSVEKELNAALKLKPDYAEALNFLGYFYLEQDKNIDQAGIMIRRALALDKGNGAYLDSLGWFYYKKGKFKEAQNYLEQAASVLSDPEIYNHLGDTFLKLGDLSNAKLNWEKSLKLNSQQDEVKTKILQLTINGK